MILAGDEAQVQFATVGVRLPQSDTHGGFASLGAVSLSYTPDPVAPAPYPRRTVGPARLSLRHSAGSQAGYARSRDRYAPHLPRSHDAGARLSYADPYKMAG